MQSKGRRNKRETIKYSKITEQTNQKDEETRINDKIQQNNKNMQSKGRRNKRETIKYSKITEQTCNQKDEETK